MNPMLTISDEEIGLIGVKFDRWDGERAQYTWTVEVGGRVYTGNDLRMGASDKLSCVKALTSLLVFLSAFAEAVDYSHRIGEATAENLDLFPEDLREWAYGVGSDQFGLLASDLGEDD